MRNGWCSLRRRIWQYCRSVIDEEIQMMELFYRQWA